jgi:alcohol dehydrogenase YqhD (iron-dependent ADH family)
MNDFTYYNPTKIEFGKGKENEVGSYVKKHGKKVLVHYGGSSLKKLGVIDRVLN